MSLAYGIDVSNWEKLVDWKKLRDQGFSFAFIKATHGSSEINTFKEQWSGAKEAGILRGAYHFFLQDVSPKKQVDQFLLSLDKDIGELMPIIDVERTRVWDEAKKQFVTSPIKNPAKYASDINFWLLEVEKHLKSRPMVYTAKGIWDEVMRINNNFPSWAPSYPLWVANYLDLPDIKVDVLSVDIISKIVDNISQNKYSPKPSMPKSWDRWTFWQFTAETYHLEGVNTLTQEGKVVPPLVDINVFKGTLDELRGLAHISSTPSPEKEVVPYTDITKFSNQRVLTAFFTAFGDRGEMILKGTGLLPQLNADPAGLYNGPGIADISSLSFEQELALNSAFSREITNQMMINLFFKAFGEANYWEVVKRAGLENIAENRKAVYSGPWIDQLTLSEDEKNTLKAGFSSI